MISKESLEEFKKIYKNKFHKDLSDQEALDKATSLLDLVKAVYKPMTLKEHDVLQKRRLETGDITEKELKESLKNIKDSLKKPRN